MQAAANSFDVILNTTSADLPWAQYINLLKHFGKFMQCGAPPSALQIAPFQLIFKNISVSGTLIGSPSETQEMLEFAAAHNIVSQVETLPLSEVNTGIKKVLDNDVRYRVVLIVP
jgi:D-arabinose 1-dehydrogenase-like Zn-dependent alcohol dehydrogenase